MWKPTVLVSLDAVFGGSGRIDQLEMHLEERIVPLIEQCTRNRKPRIMKGESRWITSTSGRLAVGGHVCDCLLYLHY
jgi:hypothetical protein